MGLGTGILIDLINLVFGIYIFIVMVRLMLQLTRADFYNPISQGIVRLTNPPLIPLRRIIPGLFGIDIASLVLMYGLSIIKLVLIMIVADKGLNLLAIAIVAALQLVQLMIYIFMGAIFFRIIISWINPQGTHGNPVYGLLVSLSEPLMRPARRILPAMGGFDFSPILVLFVLGIALRIITHLFGI